MSSLTTLPSETSVFNLACDVGIQSFPGEAGCGSELHNYSTSDTEDCKTLSGKTTVTKKVGCLFETF